MSRVGKKPLPLKSTITVTVNGRRLTVKGPKATLERELPAVVGVTVEKGAVVVTRANDGRAARAQHGLARSLINNMLIGVEAGFKKELEIRGVGYRGDVKGKNLALSLGFSHPIAYPIPAGIAIAVDKNNVITITGADKEQVGQVAAEIRAFRKPEVYKGKGIRYVGERVIQKAGKTV